MIPGNDETDIAKKDTGQIGHWLRPFRCSICLHFILFYPISLKEPVEAPEPRHEWILCKACYEALLVEIRRSVIRSPVRLRIAMGLVAAERSPKAYIRHTYSGEQRQFQQEFAWFMRLLILFGLLHVVIFVILLAVPR